MTLSDEESQKLLETLMSLNYVQGIAIEISITCLILSQIRFSANFHLLGIPLNKITLMLWKTCWFFLTNSFARLLNHLEPDNKKRKKCGRGGILCGQKEKCF